MLFNSPVYYLLFLPVAAVVYFRLTRLRHAGWAIAWLTLASLFFYAYWNWRYLPLLLLSVAVNFGLGRWMKPEGRSEARLLRWRVNRRGLALLAGILFNLGLLGYFKYVDFFLANVNALSGRAIPLTGIVLPLAISFFTFQQIAYIVDCYRQEVDEHSFTHYALFVSFFPQLIAGPIVHHRQMMPQFGKYPAPNWDHIATGLAIFVLGLFKKVFIADTFSIWANAGFADVSAPGLRDAWIATASYSLQIYYDFSGYSDMAVGAALMFNIRLPINFNSPYQAVSMREFWSRWHMTLSGWLRDYLYVPLGGNRAGPARTFVNVFVTFLLGGLWHGAGWTFVAWGALHGAAVCIERGWAALRLPALPRAAAWLLTLAFVHVAWVFFRAETLADAGRMLRGMVGANGVHSTLRFESGFSQMTRWVVEDLAGLRFGSPRSEEPLVTIAVFAAIALFAPNALRICGYLEGGGRLALRRDWLWAVALGLLTGIGMTVSIVGRQQEFLYFQF